MTLLSTPFSNFDSPPLFYVNCPLINLREKPLFHSEIVSQAIFSEKIIIEHQDGKWSFIKTLDNYKGWVESNSFVERVSPYKAFHKVSRLAAHLYRKPEIKFGPLTTLPYESQLQVLNEYDAYWIKVVLPNEELAFIQKGDIALEPIFFSKNDLVNFSQKFLGLPYTWGGRSSFGYDCSGFVQMLYNKIKVNLNRDSKNQIDDTRFGVISLNEIKPGDLIFFGKTPQEIAHVGLALGQGKFIHSTFREGKPWIRISDLYDEEWNGAHNSYYKYRTGRQLLKT